MTTLLVEGTPSSGVALLRHPESLGCPCGQELDVSRGTHCPRCGTRVHSRADLHVVGARPARG